MAGLMGNAAPPGQPPPGGPPVGGQPPVGGAPPAAPTEMETNVSPEEQAQYTEFVTNAMAIMNDKKGARKMLKVIESGDDPVKGLANAVAAIVMRVEKSAKQSGQEISADVLMHGGAEILEQAADLAEQSGGHAFTEEELEKATYIAMDLYREARGDKINQEEQGASMQELQAAEADGSLEQQLPGLAEHAQKGQPQGEAPPQDQPPQQGLMG
jgi:hypothetical protein